MDTQPQLEDRRFAQLARNIGERRLQPYFYEVRYDQETETAREAQLKENRGLTPILVSVSGV